MIRSALTRIRSWKCSSKIICNTVSRRSVSLAQHRLMSQSTAPCLCGPQLAVQVRTPDLLDMPIQVPALGDISDPTLRANHRTTMISADELLCKQRHRLSWYQAFNSSDEARAVANLVDSQLQTQLPIDELGVRRQRLLDCDCMLRL